MRPNIFSYATKELALDAALCWLLAWADPRYATGAPGMNGVARELINLCLARARRPPIDVETIEVGRQANNIDVWAVVNGRLPVVIENKTGTREHSDQLERYRDAAEAWGLQEKPLLVYVQTGFQGDYGAVKKAGYVVVRRRDLAALTSSPTAAQAVTESCAFGELAAHFQVLDHAARAYEHIPIAAWAGGSAWLGFFEELQARLGDGGYDWVPYAGEFYGFWWGGGKDFDGVEPYLQLEQDKLCVKIAVTPEDAESRKRARAEWSQYVISFAQQRGLELARPGRFGLGEYMTVAVLPGDYRVTRPDGLLDLEGTFERLGTITRVLKEAVAAK